MRHKKELIHCPFPLDAIVDHAAEERRQVYRGRGRYFVSKLGARNGVTATKNSDGSFSVDYVAPARALVSSRREP